MPALIAPLLILPAIAFYPNKWVPGTLLIAHLILTADNPEWSRLPQEGDPITLFAPLVLLFLVVTISTFERGWLAPTATNRIVLGGTFLAAFLTYYVLEGPIVRLGTYTSDLVTVLLLIALPWTATWLRKRHARGR